ncbi:MAG TPA: DNA mismatch repair protein MutS, partial [Methanomicrobiales archaeon]|nr:DNA mismatch repair protein MutS [Methanomicrobiales archaeon]
RGSGRDATLLSLLDCTETSMGSRLLRTYLTSPLLSVDAIETRLDAVEHLAENTVVRASLRTLLHRCADIERIAGRIAYGNAGPKDLIRLRDTLLCIPEVREEIRASVGKEGKPARLFELAGGLLDLPDTIDLVSRAIQDDPPATTGGGDVIRDGYDEKLDELRLLTRSGKKWILDLQQRERERTKIRSLKVGHNNIFGYYIEVSRPNLHLVPPEYERKQTTANGERFTTTELREKEAAIATAEERLLSLEGEIYTALIASLQGQVPDLLADGRILAELDVYAALAEVARSHGYARPVLDAGAKIEIREGRHPVVDARMRGGFVPNDTLLDSGGDQILIITGANMAGKSTYMRGVALIVILAQMGSFVPAEYARIGMVDRIFTRVGAFDDLASGQSTFMVEMLELANILNNVTERSLVIL